MLDQTKILLMVAFALLVLVLVSNGKRPTAETPISGSEPVEGATQTPHAQTDLVPSWAANVPSQMTPPLVLMIPTVGIAPTGGTCD